MPGVEIRDGYGLLIKIETWGTKTMTHEELVARAVKWLKGTMRCWVTLTDPWSTAWERPDAIGWQSSRSYLVECKASRSDFLRDVKKPHRSHPDQGMGDFRYYMTPPGLIGVEELPEHWGLLEVKPRQVRVIRHGYRFAIHKSALKERPLLIRALRDARADLAKWAELIRAEMAQDELDAMAASEVSE